MYFDFEDYRPDISPVGRAISWREGILLSVIVHLAAVILVLLAPEWLPLTRDRAVDALDEVQAPRDDESARFVFVTPRADIIAPRPPDRAAPPSDADRVARAPEPVPDPANAMPFSRGSTPEPVEPTMPEERQRSEPDPAPPEPAGDQAGPPGAPSSGTPAVPEAQNALLTPPRQPGLGPSAGGSPLSEALRNLQQYVEREQFNNPQGSTNQFGPAIQFDTKGVEFGPWIRRFVAQVRGNWEPLIPQAAMSMSGHVVLTFNVHRGGAITDLTVTQPSSIGAFTTAAYGALVSSNPTAPLPSEYPADQAFFTVTFFYNERPD